MEDSHDDFEALSGLIGSYLNQDLYVSFASAPEAVADFANSTDESGRRKLLHDMVRFLELHDNDLEGEFERRYGFDFAPSLTGRSVREFFDMVKGVLASPNAYLNYETATERAASTTSG